LGCDREFHCGDWQLIRPFEIDFLGTDSGNNSPDNKLNEIGYTKQHVVRVHN